MDLMFYGNKSLGCPSNAVVELSEGFLSSTVINSTHMRKTFEDKGDAVERIILFDCIGDYLENRLFVRGRPWVCAISTVFADLYSTYRTGLSVDEMNIHLILSNCKTFVDNSKGLAKFAYPLWYAKREYFPSKELDIRALFSCNVPNIEDRDWSLVDHIQKYLEKRGLPPVLIGRSSVFSSDFDSITTGKNPLNLFESPSFVSGYFEIIAPRITDYRAGVIPHEILAHLGFRRRVIAMRHQVLEPISDYIYNFASLTALDAALSTWTKGDFKSTADRPPLAKEFQTDIESLKEIMKNSHRAWLDAGKALIVASKEEEDAGPQITLESSVEGQMGVKSGSPS